MNENYGFHDPIFLKLEDLDDESAKVYHFLMTPKLHERLYERYIVKLLDTLPKKKREALKQLLGQEAKFQISSTIFPGYLRHIRTQMRKTKWYRKQVHELTYLIVLDLLYGKKTTMKKAKERSKADATTNLPVWERPDERTRRRFFKYYPYLLSKPIRDMADELEDKREAPYSSVFTEPSIGNTDPIELLSMPVKLDEYDIKIRQLQEAMMPIHAMYQMVEPYDTEELIEFHEYLQKVIPEMIGDNGAIEEENEWILRHFQFGTDVAEALFQTIWLSVMHHWFQKKQPAMREKISNTIYPLIYTRKDAANAVKYTKQWIKDPAKIFDIILRGVQGLGFMGRQDAGIWLYEECEKQIDFAPVERGLLQHNFAATYLELGKYKKYKSHLLKAMGIWEELKSEYDIGITYAFLAEAYYLGGDKNRSLHAKEKCMTILSTLNDDHMRLARGLILVADRARNIRDYLWELEALSLGFDHVSSDGNDILFEYYQGRLSAIDSGRNPSMLERMGILIRPSPLQWYRIGDGFHPVTPRESTKTV